MDQQIFLNFFFYNDTIKSEEERNVSDKFIPCSSTTYYI